MRHKNKRSDTKRGVESGLLIAVVLAKNVNKNPLTVVTRAPYHLIGILIMTMEFKARIILNTIKMV